MENIIKTYSLPIRNFTFENTNNSQFLKTKFFAIAEGENLNRSSFDIAGIIGCLEENDYTFKPILGSWKKDEVTEVGFGNFGGHDKDIEYDTMSGEIYDTYLGDGNERPLGLILPNTAKIEEFKGKRWLTFEGLIWAEYNKEAVRLLKKRRTNNVSVEIKVLDSYLDGDIEIIKRFTLLGITIIGVKPGIENAHLDIMNFSTTPQFSNFVRVFSSKIDNLEGITMEFLQKEKFGSGEKLTMDLSKDSASNDTWGPINKTKLRNDLLRAKNYKSLIPKSYLVVMDGWEESPSEKLKYPIVQIKNGKVVLNINGIQAAGSYLMKEKDQPYFRTAKAKLNRIRKILGMEKLMSLEFGIETNVGIDCEVSQNQPHIIKMEGGKNAKMVKKETLSKLTRLFKDKDQIEKDYKQLSASYEEKVGEYEYAEEDKKECAKTEMETAKTEMEAKENELKTCSKSIIELSSSLVANYDDDNDDDDKYPDIDDEEEECPVDEEGKSKYASKLEEGCSFVSNSKNYVVFEKDGNLFSCKYSVSNNGELNMAETTKCEKLFAVVPIVTGGVGSPEDAVAMPKVNVEVTKGISKLYDTIKERDSKIAEMQKELDKANESVQMAEQEKERYKVDVKSMLSKFEELTYSENTTKEFKEEMYTKIFESSFTNLEDLETKVKAGLYELNKNKFLSGNYSRNQQNNNLNYKTETQQIDDIIKSYDKK